MGKCEFLDSRKKCFFCKQICLVPKDKVSICKFVIRQNPADPEIRRRKVREALSVVAEKRGAPVPEIKDEDILLGESVYANVSRLKAKIPAMEFVIRERKTPTPEEIVTSRGVLEAFLDNSIKKNRVSVQDRNEAKKSLVLDYDGRRVICFLRIPPSKFLLEMKKKRKPEKFFWESIREMRGL